MNDALYHAYRQAQDRYLKALIDGAANLSVLRAEAAEAALKYRHAFQTSLAGASA
ncbi:hypothetical protein MF271_19040 (plasmid) [Deinococcus sp. KNUC1210]|uniref:hypothetical protein n=1 Tax=Deinococcus sp. KNUC1210 TaxID=2917691 RepID=UPI001EF0B389|nr:hypothetical protein [Deinococcus sp. KNUC1210]ULH17417.1 hypothetical protein MF271_19040 [Deinococcus sp. KNUC1210]